MAEREERGFTGRPWEVERDRFGLMFSQPITVGECVEVVPADAYQGAVSVLEAIRDADPVDMALDPQWASRVAAVALKAMGITTAEGQ